MRQKTRKAIHAANARLTAMIKAFDGLIYVCSQDYRIEFMNDRLIERTGHDATGELCYEALHDRDSICPWCVNERVFKGETVRWEVKSPKDNRWFYVANSPINNGDDTISKQSMMLDITERKELCAALMRSEEKYRELVENANSIILRMDRLGNVIFVNEYARRFFGYSEEEMLGRNIVGTIVPELESTGRDLKGLIEDIGVHPELYVNNVNENMRRNGERVWIAWTNKPIRSEDGRVVEILCIGNDITARKQAEEALWQAHDNLEKTVKERTAELRESEKQLRSLSSRLLSAQEEERKRIARDLHDSIGQSLAALKFNVEYALAAARKEPIGEELVRSLECLVPMIQNSIDETRRIYGGLRPSILDDLGIIATIGWFCRNFQVTCPSIRIERMMRVDEHEIPEPLKIVIFRILQEALNNVAKYSKADLASLSLGRTGDVIELTIKDNGVGFDLSSVLSRDSWERGLGLSGMRERTELSGGVFAMESIRGEGTRIHAQWHLEGSAFSSLMIRN